jgi:hypothetical protein
MGYRGSKTSPGVLQRIISEFPVHRIYIEPFVGAGTVVLAKLPAAVSIVLDRDPVQVDLVVRAAAAAGVSACARSPLSLASELMCGADAGRLGRLLSSCCLFGLVACGVEFLEAFEPVGDELVYADPPYLVNRHGQSRRRLYRFDMGDVVSHERLLARLLDLKCAVAVSGYRCDLYDRLLVEWRRVDYTTSTRGGPAVESLWCNFSPPSVLFDASFFGGDRRRRQDWRRMCRRMEQRFAKLDSVRRGALLKYLTDAGAARVGR